MSEDFTVERAREKLEEFKAGLVKLVPDPSTYRLLDLDKDYTPVELRDLLQHYSSYLATLYSLRGRIRAESIIVDRGFKTGMAVARARSGLSKATVADREAEILSENQGFRDLKKMQIFNETYEALLDGWIEAYAQAYAGASRITSLFLGETEHLSLRSN